jgi:hypothetical protein
MNATYRALIALHPRSFRSQFGPEMELIFEESGRPFRLLLDALVSLGRQWLLRTRAWVFAVAAVGGMIPFALGLGFLSFTRRYFGVAPVVHHAHRVVAAPGARESATQPFVMLTATIAVMFILGTMLLAIAWFRQSIKRRRA